MAKKSDIHILKEKYEPTWKEAYNIFPHLIRKNNFTIGAEIGIAFGGHAENILSTTHIKKIFGVDPYRHILSYKDPLNLSQSQFNALYKFVRYRLKKFGKRYQHIRKSSHNAATTIPFILDFVYIDGDHSYNGVTDDLRSWFPLIHDGGIIGGHDYNHANHPGVKQAIDDFFNRFNWKINIERGGVWWLKKQPLNISFVIPAYNCQKTLAESVESIYNDNFTKGDEVIIVDDASIDETLKLARSLQKKYPTIRIFRHNYNKGSAAAGRNTGIDNSKNELIFCLDADNVLYPKSIPKLKKYMINIRADTVAFGELRYFKKNIQNVTHKWIYKEKIMLYDVINNTTITPCGSGNYLFTKTSWLKAGRYNESSSIIAYDSWSFGFCQLATGSKMVTMPNSFYYHRYGYESTYVKEVKKINPSLTILQIILPFIDLFDEREVDYIMGKKGRHIWFNNLEKHPLRLKEVKFQKISYFKNRLLNKIKKTKILLDKYTI